MPRSSPSERAPDQSIAITVRVAHGENGTLNAWPATQHPTMSCCEARGLVKDYRRARAVDGVDLVVHAGERVALLGPNGAGKTTTLLMVLGVVSPDAGDVDDLRLRLARKRSQAAMNVGFAAGYLPLTERMRVREYLTLYGQLYGLADPTPGDRGGPRTLPCHHLARRDGHRAVVRAAHADRHRAGDAAPPSPARPRRADRVARSRRRAAGAHRPARPVARVRVRAADDEPRHERRRARCASESCSSRTGASSPTRAPREVASAYGQRRSRKRLPPPRRTARGDGAHSRAITRDRRCDPDRVRPAARHRGDDVASARDLAPRTRT